jgi:hypothetical protein
LHSTIIHKRRLSLPASLLEPIPNLEYWHYADRPDIFARSVSFDPLAFAFNAEAHCDVVGYVRRYCASSMGDSPDELERMLSVMRYSFSNQLKFVRYKIGKPYNSTLGKFGHANRSSVLRLIHSSVYAVPTYSLGEHFQCNWSLSPVTFDPKTKAPVINAYKFDPSTSGGERELVAMSAMSTPMVAAVETGDDV